MSQNKELKKALLAISSFTLVFGIVLWVLFSVLVMIGVSSTGLLRIVCWIMASIFMVVIMIGLIVCFKRLNGIRRQIMLNNIYVKLKELGFTTEEIDDRQKVFSQQKLSRLKNTSRKLSKYIEEKRQTK
ncbi:hypothetical protein [Staphylococcus warneri]|uniref:hypothetical protein n=1 Tax=Staphylococcus warneri TaxID=1292 RepID=UPI0022E0A1AC|nr:hypothetical protein [Staphylococcus warneri]